MVEKAHPAFVENVRCMLVNPRRNVRRAIERMEQMGIKSGGKNWNAIDYAREALEQIEAVEGIVRDEDQHHVHRCSCGHVHYTQGDEA